MSDPKINCSPIPTDKKNSNIGELLEREGKGEKAEGGGGKIGEGKRR